MNSKIIKIRRAVKRSTILTIVKNFLRFIYSAAENILLPYWWLSYLLMPANKRLPFRIYKMNRLMKIYYHRPEMGIYSTEGIEYVDFKTDDDKNISGIKYRCNPKSNKWVIACHWFGGNKFWSLYNTFIFRKLGYNVLAFDFRGHGESSKDSATLGAKEIYDLKGAISYLNNSEKTDHIALYGISLGAFCVSYIGVEFDSFCKNNNVKLGVCESAFESIKSLFYHTRNSRMKLLVPKTKTKKSIDHLLERENKSPKNRGIDLQQISVIKKLEQIDKPAFPILFFQSLNDRYVSSRDAYEVYIARREKTKDDKLCIVHYGRHALFAKYHFKYYQKNIGEFIASIDNNQKLWEIVSNKYKIYVDEKKDQKSLACQ